MVSLFSESEKLNSRGSFILKQTPSLAAFINAKTNGRQNLYVKLLGSRPIAYSQIDVIEKTRAHAMILHGAALVVH
jgi:hypothetical protein